MDILRNIDVDSLLNSDVSNSSPQLWLENDTTPNLSAEIIAKLPRSRLRLKEKSRLLPERAVIIMNEWYKRNYQNPYPTYREIELMAQRGSISIAQVKQWFVNIRRRTGNQFRKKRDTRVVEPSTNDETTDEVANQSINTTTFSPNVSSYDVNQSTSTPASRPIYYPNSYPYYYNNYPYSPTVASPSSYYPNSSPIINSFYPYYNNFASYYSPASNSFSSQSSSSDSNPSTSVNDSNQSMANNSTSTFYPPYFNY